MLRDRRHFMIIALIMMTSVFLSSCGLGLPFELSVRITSDGSSISVSSDPVDFEFEAGPSLFLLYAYSDDARINFDAGKSELNSSFNKTIQKKPAVPLDTRDVYFEYTSTLEDKQVSVYLFSPLSSNILSNDFSYHHRLHVQDGKVNESISYEIDPENGQISVVENVFEVRHPLESGYYYIFAGVTSSNGSYLDVSSLYYIDEFEINN